MYLDVFDLRRSQKGQKNLKASGLRLQSEAGRFSGKRIKITSIYNSTTKATTERSFQLSKNFHDYWQRHWFRFLRNKPMVVAVGPDSIEVS
jgi:hypothetical protein